jgi:hypothetical protein
MRLKPLRIRSLRTLGVLVLVGALSAAVATRAAASGTDATVPRYDHIALIVEENHGFADIIGADLQPGWPIRTVWRPITSVHPTPVPRTTW